MDDDPAPIADGHLFVDRLVGSEGVFEVAADDAVYAQAEPRGFNAELHKPFLCHCLIEMPRPLVIRIPRGNDVGDGGVGMAAQIDSFHAQDVVSAASAA